MTLRNTAALPLMTGIPDDALAKLSLNTEIGKLQYALPGTASFYAQLSEEVRARLHLVYFGPGIRLVAGETTPPQPLVNYIADADTTRIALQMLLGFVQQTHSACFNHPSAVLASTRDGVARRLAGIEGVIVPLTVRHSIAEPSDLRDGMDSLGLVWPVIVRIAGVHGGESTVRIDSPDQTAHALRAIPWGGRELYLTQFVPYADSDGLHRKMRIVVVGREVFIRHLIVADEWHVHARDNEARFEAEEQAVMTSFDQALLPDIRERVLAIADALQLDFFGIDCSLRPDGRLLIFEANAAMNVLANSRPHARHSVVAIERIRAALVALLFDVPRWRHPLDGRPA